MSIRAHLYELGENVENFGNESRIIEELYNKIYDSSDFGREYIVISREEMEKIISMMREIAREYGDLWDWARERFEDDIELFGGEDEWRAWVGDLSDDIERTIKESEKDKFLIWYY